LTKYSEELDDCYRQIDEDGGTTTYYARSVVADATKPWLDTTVTETTHTVKCVVTSTDLTKVFSDKAGIAGKYTIYLAAKNLGFIPDFNDRIAINSDILSVCDINIIQPDLTPLMYILQVK
jgi:hypothetical protein